MARPYNRTVPKGVTLYVDHDYQKYVVSLAQAHRILANEHGISTVVMKQAGVEGQARVYRTKGGKFAARYPDEPGYAGYFDTIAGALDDAYRMLFQTLNLDDPYPAADISRWQIPDPLAGLVLDDDITLFTHSHQSQGGDCFVPCPLSKAVHELRREGNGRIYVRAQGAAEGQFVCIKRTGKKRARFNVRVPWWSNRWESGHRWADFRSLKSALDDASDEARKLPKKAAKTKKSG